MKKLLYSLYAITLLCYCSNCKVGINRTTVVFSKVFNDINQPIEGVEMVLYGQKGILASRTTRLKSTLTDAKGEYIITFEIPTDYHSGDIVYEWSNSVPPLYEKYTGGSVYFNGQQTQNCCRLEIGTKSQYDFEFVRK